VEAINNLECELDIKHITDAWRMELQSDIDFLEDGVLTIPKTRQLENEVDRNL
jgi:hypothetical protein